MPVQSSVSTLVLRSETQRLLVISRTRTAAGSRSFAVTAPVLFNGLPQDVRECVRKSVFRKKMFDVLLSPYD